MRGVLQLWELNSLSKSAVKVGAGKKRADCLPCIRSRAAMWSTVVKFMLWWQCGLPAQTSSPCWGSEQQVSFQHGGNRLTMTSSLPGSLPPLLFFSVVPLFFPPLSLISYVSVKAEKSLTSWVPEMKLVGGRSGGTSPCAPPPPSHSAFVQGRGEERHTEVKIKRNTCLG